MISEEEKFFVSSGMAKFGGSFAKALGNALACADPDNTRRIKEAFPECWKKYLKMGKIDNEREQAGE